MSWTNKAQWSRAWEEFDPERDHDYLHESRVTVTVHSPTLVPPKLELTFRIRNLVEYNTSGPEKGTLADDALWVELIKPEGCWFVFEVWGAEGMSSCLSAQPAPGGSVETTSRGFKCELEGIGRGKRLLPRLFVGAMHALKLAGYTFAKIKWDSNADFLMKEAWNEEEYTNAEDKDAYIAELTKKLSWRLRYYKSLGFEVEYDEYDMQSTVREWIEERETVDPATQGGREYVSYEGELVKLCKAWEDKYQLRVTTRHRPHMALKRARRARELAKASAHVFVDPDGVEGGR